MKIGMLKIEIPAPGSGLGAAMMRTIEERGRELERLARGSEPKTDPVVEEFKAHEEALRKAIGMRTLPDEKEFAAMTPERRRRVVADEMNFLELAVATFVCRKGTGLFAMPK